MTNIKSARLRGEKRWAIKNTVRLEETFLRFCNTCCSVSLSKALVASSNMRIGADARNNLANAIRCLCPPDNAVPLSPTLFS